MKLTKRQPEVAKKETQWEIGDWFIVEIPGEETFLRHIVYKDRIFHMHDINGICKFTADSSGRMGSMANDAMAEYERLVGPATKVRITEVIFEEVTE